MGFDADRALADARKIGLESDEFTPIDNEDDGLWEICLGAKPRESQIDELLARRGIKRNKKP